MTGAARGVWAGVLASLLLISPAEAEAEPEAAPFPPEAAGRPGCYTHTHTHTEEVASMTPEICLHLKHQQLLTPSVSCRFQAKNSIKYIKPNVKLGNHKTILASITVSVTSAPEEQRGHIKMSELVSLQG